MNSVAGPANKNNSAQQYPPLVFAEGGKIRTWRIQREGRSILTVCTDKGALTGRVEAAFSLPGDSALTATMEEIYEHQKKGLSQEPVGGSPAHFNPTFRRLNFDEYDFAAIAVMPNAVQGQATVTGSEVHVRLTSREELVIPLLCPFGKEVVFECFGCTDTDTGSTEITLTDVVTAQLLHAGITVLDPPFFLRNEIMRQLLTAQMVDSAQEDYWFSPAVVTYCTDQADFVAALRNFKCAGFSAALIRRVDLPYQGHEPGASLFCDIP